MSPMIEGRNVLSWASVIETGTILQAEKTARLPFIAGHVALMPDAHVGMGSTVGSVVPTMGAIIPSCVGVDIGCGMVANRTSLMASDLPDNLDELMPLVEKRIPAGVGKGHIFQEDVAWRASKPFVDDLMDRGGMLSSKQTGTAINQFGTLGSGNHFVEVCLDETNHVWTVLHSGSRGVGNQLATEHIDGAKKLMKAYFVHLEDPDLAYLVEGTEEFANYITAMLWAQDYAFESRAQMNREIARSLFQVVGYGAVKQTINCHHNFTEKEHHHGKDLWITRKGAIRMREGDWGIIPGSMGTDTYIVTGRNNPASYASASHGAGRRMSRSQARRELTSESLTEAMGARTWNSGAASSLVDEHPAAYKDISQVMADQADLCTIEFRLHQVFNYKGTGK